MSSPVDENVAPESDHIIEFETENGTLASPESGEAAPDPLEARLAEIREQYGEDADKSQGDPESTNDEATEEVAAKSTSEEEETETDSTADSEVKETKGQQLRKLLTKEKQLREDRKQFAQESKEHAEKLAQFEQAQRLASVDPIAYLKTLGLDDDTLQDVAKSIFYDALGDDAPDEYKGERELRSLQRKLAKLESDVTRRDEEKAERAKQASSEQALNQYIDGLRESVADVDAEASPSIGKVLDLYDTDTVLADMVNVANAYGLENPNDAPLTASEIFDYLEGEYSNHLAKLNPEPQAATEQKAAKKPKTLRNNISSKQPASEAPDPEKDWEAYKQHCRDRGMSQVNEIYKKSGY